MLGLLAEELADVAGDRRLVAAIAAGEGTPRPPTAGRCSTRRRRPRHLKGARA